MKLILPGGSGQIGRILCRAFHSAGHEVIVLSRAPTNQPWRVVAWDANSLGSWTAQLEGADAVINLTGRSVDCRYTPKNRRQIMESRVNSTRIIGQAIAQAARPPQVWLQAATATIYANRYDANNDEITGILGGNEPNVPDTWRFSIEVAKAWEQAINDAIVPRTRKVILRSAMVMSPDRGGVFDTLSRLVRFSLGGRAGDGKQFMSWIHDQDFIRAVLWLIEREDFSGPVNIASRNPLPNEEFMRELRSACGVRFGLSQTKWMLEIGTAILRTESELILKSRRVSPRRLLEAGFAFEFPAWAQAARELIARRKSGVC